VLSLPIREGPNNTLDRIRMMVTDSATRGAGARLGLWTCLGIYRVEHRDRPRQRDLILHLVDA
jgi:hypothetical protein